MMSDHDDFSCLQFPKEWGHPRFNLGDRVQAGGIQGIVTGVHYVHPDGVSAVWDDAEPGWWIEVTGASKWMNCTFGEGEFFHNSVIHALPNDVGSVSQPQTLCHTPPHPLHPLNGGV